ncbi:MAG: transcription termination/antitermination NusG family protein [Anaerolineales bacterium]
MAVSWYAMRSKSNKEEFLAGQLDSYGIEVFYPRIRVKPVNPRARKIVPYFPNYLFIHVDLEVTNISDLRWMPGASGVVSFDGDPASVPDLLIGTLQKQVDALNVSHQSLLNELKRGDVVWVQSGPFAGYEAIFDERLPGRDRVRVLLGFLQKRQIPLELREQQIGRAKRS